MVPMLSPRQNTTETISNYRLTKIALEELWKTLYQTVMIINSAPLSKVQWCQWITLFSASHNNFFIVNCSIDGVELAYILLKGNEGNDGGGQ